MIQIGLLLRCLFFVLQLQRFWSLENYDLPIIPPKLQSYVRNAMQEIKHSTSDKSIPRHVWFAVRNSSDAQPNHIVGKGGLIEKNPTWRFHFCGNEEKDEFMNVYFANSSFLWAYHIINPVIGTAKSELWRLAILYVKGGLYLDDDATLETPLDEIVQPSDKLILGKEGYNWTDNCYQKEYVLSNDSLTKRFGELNQQIFYENKYLFNWAIFASPGNPILERIMYHIVMLIKAEYLGPSAIKMSPTDHRGKLLMCISTFPITLAIREMLLENKSHAMGIHIGGEQFVEYGGNMKAWNNDYNPNRWVKQMKRGLPYLHSYNTHHNIERYEGMLIQGHGKREIYLIQHLQKHLITNLNIFYKYNFSFDEVRMVSSEWIHTIEKGDDLV